MMKLAYLVGCIGLFFFSSCRKKECETCGQMPFDKVYGGTKDDGAQSIISTTDKGFLVSGSTFSSDGDVNGNHGRGDALIMKLNNNGKLEWSKTYGGSSTDGASAAVATPDGGYIIIGLTDSNDGDFAGNHGNSDIWVLKLDANGNKVWLKLFGGSALDEPSTIIASADGGYTIIGTTTSNNGDISGNHGYYDAWVFKIDPSGNKLWSKTYGTSDYETGYSIANSPDGGYVFAGSAPSTVLPVSENASITKIDANGNQLWQRSLGGSGNESFNSVINGTDGGYIASGITSSNNGDVVGKHGTTSTGDIWVVKVDVTGKLVWQKTFGVAGIDYQTRSFVKDADGGYILAGGTVGDDSGAGSDGLVIKMDIAANQLWEKKFGGSAGDSFFNMIDLPGWGYAFTGSTLSNDKDISGSHGGLDAWVVTMKK